MDWGTLRRSGIGWGTLGEVREGSVTLGEVRDSSGDPRGGLGWVEGHSGRSRTGRGTLGWSRTGRGTFGRFATGRGTLGEVWDGSGDTRGGLGRVVDPMESPGLVERPSGSSTTSNAPQ